MTETYQERIRRKITTSFNPILLEIKDDSKKHAGHAGHDPKGETHFVVHVVSDVFEGKGRVERHRMVYAVLADELKERVHAINLKLVSKSEYNL